jgi:hypothetical protein
LAPHPSCDPSIAEWSNGEVRQVKKLHDLKQWLTVADAARYLSIVFGEDVTEADVLRLGLDGHLRLSVYFVNGASGRCGPVIPIDDAKVTTWEENPDDWSPGPSIGEVHVLNEANLADMIGEANLPAWKNLTDGPSTGEAEAEGEAKGKVRVFGHSRHGLLLGDGRVLEHDRKTTWIAGVWDLTMLGHERLEIEQRYWLLTEGPDVDRSFRDSALDHTIVSREDGTYCRLHDLPADSVVVVRTAALHDLEARISEPDQRTEKPIERRERATLLVMIAALARLAKIDVSKPSGAATIIETQTNLMGVRVAARTIENHLKAIPEALERRTS